jgi:mRNA-degrading endonuclease RelE of RelBE toxin-antitoxin system
MAYIALVIFVETPTFTRRVLELLDDESYHKLQLHLSAHPDAGAIIRGSGGMRKIRWAGSGRGKRGGVRVIYYWWVANSRISMLLVYAKNEQDDLTPDQLKALKGALELDV